MWFYADFNAIWYSYESKSFGLGNVFSSKHKTQLIFK